MLFEVLGDDARVLDVVGHAQRQRLESLQEEERVDRRQAGADVAELLDPQLRAERVLAEVVDRSADRRSWRRARSSSGSSRCPTGTDRTRRRRRRSRFRGRRGTSSRNARRCRRRDRAAGTGRRRQRRVDHQRDAAACATSARPSRSAIEPDGFAISSVYTSFVSGRIAAANASDSSDGDECRRRSRVGGA